MREPGTRLLVLHDNTPENVLGFVSWQVDIEDVEAVIYWYTLLLLQSDHSYELQLSPRIQRSGLGRQLMNLLEQIGSSFHLSKAMLTVFTSNISALNFYTTLGYPSSLPS